eukprot:3339946-Rhodomonas_salina.1
MCSLSSLLTHALSSDVGAHHNTLLVDVSATLPHTVSLAPGLGPGHGRLASLSAAQAERAWRRGRDEEPLLSFNATSPGHTLPHLPASAGSDPMRGCCSLAKRGEGVRRKREEEEGGRREDGGRE